MAVSGDGSTAVVGADKHTTTGGAAAGAAYVFTDHRKKWRQVQELTAADGVSGDGFGFGVAVSNDGSTVVVAAPSAQKVYVFARSKAAWKQTGEITNPGSGSGLFATAIGVSSDGRTIVVSTFGGEGVTYVFSKSGKAWTQSGELSEDGLKVAISGDGSTVVVGDQRAAGAAYVFVRSGGTWSLVQTLTASDGAADDHFGNHVGVSDDGSTLVVGASGHDSQTGAAYVFVRKGKAWKQTQELTASDGASGDHFGVGATVSGDGSTVVVGADGKASGTGAGYVFTRHRKTRKEAREVTASDGAPGDSFGIAVEVSVDGSEAMFGAWGHDPLGTAYMFKR